MQQQSVFTPPSKKATLFKIFQRQSASSPPRQLQDPFEGKHQFPAFSPGATSSAPRRLPGRPRGNVVDPVSPQLDTGLSSPAPTEQLTLMMRQAAIATQSSIDLSWLDSAPSTPPQPYPGSVFIPNPVGLSSVWAGVIPTQDTSPCAVVSPPRPVHANLTWPSWQSDMVRSAAHVWDKDGKHVAFRKAKTVFNMMKVHFKDINEGTVANKVSKERKNFDSKSGEFFATQPDPTAQHQAVQRHAAIEAELNAEHPVQQHTKKGRPFVLSPVLYHKIKEHCEKLRTSAGFGVHIVAAIAAKAHRDSFHFDLVDDSWIPSASWCYWFMDTHMNLSHRRVTTDGSAAAELSEKQVRLKELLKESLALDLAEGVLPALMLMSDEFGVQFFPQSDYVWAERGAKHACAGVKDDKRQFTGNVVITAAGNVAFAQYIYGGKSEKSLPSKTALAEFEECVTWLLGFSENHWSNLMHKKRLIEHMVLYRAQFLKKCIEQGTMTASSAAVAPMVVILDCWPVNICDEFRNWVKNKFSFIRLRFIPAGMTSKLQINDTHLHHPIKALLIREAGAWYMQNLQQLLQLHEDGRLKEDEFKAQVAALMNIGVLRDLSVRWSVMSFRHIQGHDKDSNMVLKGWINNFGEIFQYAYQQRALLKRDELRVREAETQLELIALAQEERHRQIPPPATEFESGVPSRELLSESDSEAESDDEDDDHLAVVTQQTNRSLLAANSMVGVGAGGGLDVHNDASYEIMNKKSLAAELLKRGIKVSKREVRTSLIGRLNRMDSDQSPSALAHAAAFQRAAAATVESSSPPLLSFSIPQHVVSSAQTHRSKLETALNTRNKMLFDNVGEGDCLLYSLRDSSLFIFGQFVDNNSLRGRIVATIRDRRHELCGDEFSYEEAFNLLYHDVSDVEVVGDQWRNEFSDCSFDEYLVKMSQSGVFMDNLCVQAVSDALNIYVHLIHSMYGWQEYIPYSMRSVPAAGGADGRRVDEVTIANQSNYHFFGTSPPSV